MTGCWVTAHWTSDVKGQQLQKYQVSSIAKAGIIWRVTRYGGVKGKGKEVKR